MHNDLEGVVRLNLKTFSDERGSVLHMLRADSPHFKKFGEIYFSTINPGIIKGWKKHQKVTQLMVVPVGMVKIVLHDSRSDSSTFGQTQSIDFGLENYIMLKIPPQIWYAFKSISSGVSLIANCIDEPHDPLEGQVLPLNTPIIPYKWDETV